jgi:hypothetical protein
LGRLAFSAVALLAVHTNIRERQGSQTSFGNWFPTTNAQATLDSGQLAWVLRDLSLKMDLRQDGGTTPSDLRLIGRNHRGRTIPRIATLTILRQNLRRRTCHDYTSDVEGTVFNYTAKA